MRLVNLLLARYAPLLISGVATVLLAAMTLLGRFQPSFEFLEHIEWKTYDWRVRSALEYPLPISDKLGFVMLDPATLAHFNKVFEYQWPLPRKVYGEVVRNLTAQGAKAIAFDIFFEDVARDRADERVRTADGGEISSDAYFAGQIGKAGNVILGAQAGVAKGTLGFPADIFLKQAAGVGHARRIPDGDGVLRRIRPYVDDPVHGRVWQMDLVVAARELGLDLSRAVVESGRIVFPDGRGGSRVIPLDAGGGLLVDWSIGLNPGKEVPGISLYKLALSAGNRPTRGGGSGPFADRLVLVGSIGSGNNISDSGAMPIAKDGPYFLTHLNVINTILMDRFIRRPSPWLEIALLALVTAIAGLVSWRLRALWATVAVVALAVGYVALAWWLFVAHRYWLPVVLPVAGAMLITHASMVAFRLILERHHRHRVKSLFGRIVSPSIVEMLVSQPQASWKPTRRMMTVLFADIRGFTEFTDRRRTEAETKIEKLGLSGDRAQAESDEAAAETMETVNLYLTTVVASVTKFDGTLDKYIGDSVMAFWGAPLPNQRHAAGAVRAAMEAQRGVSRLNSERAAENQRRLAVNPERALRGEELLEPLELLQVGIGMNSGIMTVGFMGSEDHLSNFTVFGDCVNLASRLQALAGPGIIIVGELTQREAVRQEPGLAQCFVSQELTAVKGVAQPVATSRVLWATVEADGKNASFGL